MAYPISDVTRRVVYTGSAGVGPYSFSFEILANTDIAVYKDSTLLTLTTDYTVTINSNGTGSVTLVTAATSANNITLVGNRAIERATDFVTGGDLFANSLNDEFDSLVIFSQQTDEKAERGLKAPVTDPTDINMVLPSKTSRAGKTLAFDSLGNPTVGEDIGNWRGDWASGTAYLVRDLVKDSSNSNVYRCNTAHTSTGTTPISSNTDVAKWDLVINAASAASSAAAAAASASAAATSASSASSSASSASTSASTASTAATNASSAQTAAEAARDATLAAYDSFDDRYLGSKSSNPTVDNDGNALIAGALYYNTTVPEMRLYTGSAWVAAYVSGASYLLTANNLSELTASAATVRSNLGLVIGTDVQAYDADTAKLDVVQTFTVAQRGAVSTLTDGTTITPDFAAANNFSVTLGGNRTLANPTNLTAGQSGVIRIAQDGTGSRTLAYGSYFKFPQGTAPTLTTTASAVDVLCYYVESTTRITARLMADVK
jgi:hypothetical protein